VANISKLNTVAAGVDPVSAQLSGPRGRKPKKRLSRRNIILYGSLTIAALYYLLPLYVMVVTSLKGMPEIRMGNIFAPPLEITFEPWVKAWSNACTGLNCDGLSRGFWNSVLITLPSTVVSIVIASVSGYALANWKFKGSEFFFSILIIGAFIPYQVMIYPIDHFQAVHVGHVQIGDDEIERAGLGFGKAICAINRFRYLITCIRQGNFGGHSDACRVIDGENVGAHCISFPCSQKRREASSMSVRKPPRRRGSTIAGEAGFVSVMYLPSARA